MPGPGLWAGLERNVTVFPQGSVGGGDRSERTLSLESSQVPLRARTHTHTRVRMPTQAALSPLSMWSRLAIQVEENEMLKAALGSALQGKEEDFSMYHETLGQVKGVFLKALRQQKAHKH